MDRLPRLPGGTPSSLGVIWDRIQWYWQRLCEAIELALSDLTQIVEDMGDLLASIILLNELITEAEEAIEAVNEITEGAIAGGELTNSYVTGLTLSATDAGTDATITISGHDRVYPKTDGTSTTVAVTGGSLTGLAYSTQYWIYYDQSSRAGGAVTYVASTTPTAQIGDRHNVGAVTTPAALGSPNTGNPTQPPGYASPEAL